VDERRREIRCPQKIPGRRGCFLPGLTAVAVFGISVIVVSRLFGPQNILREIITELLASFGSAILLFAVFGFSSEPAYSACFAERPAERPSRNPLSALESFCKTSTFEGGSLKVPKMERSWTGSK
jgi:hypothetical protein